MKLKIWQAGGLGKALGAGFSGVRCAPEGQHGPMQGLDGFDTQGKGGLSSAQMAMVAGHVSVQS